MSLASSYTVVEATPVSDPSMTPLPLASVNTAPVTVALAYTPVSCAFRSSPELSVTAVSQPPEQTWPPGAETRTMYEPGRAAAQLAAEKL